jgi:hypothetical protein
VTRLSATPAVADLNTRVEAYATINKIGASAAVKNIVAPWPAEQLIVATKTEQNLACRAADQDVGVVRALDRRRHVTPPDVAQPIMTSHQLGC